MRRALPDARLLADAKTMDEGAYEFSLCYAAGADSATAMGLAPDATLHICAAVAQRLGKQMTIDLLATSWARQERLLQTFTAARFDWHVGMDTRLASGAGTTPLWPVISCEAATKWRRAGEAASAQPLGSLFDQCSHVALYAVCLRIAQQQLDPAAARARHANVE